MQDRQIPPVIIPILEHCSVVGTVGTTAQLIWPTSFQAKLSGSDGALSATVKLWGSNDQLAATNQPNCAKILLNSFALSGTAGASVDVSADTAAYSPTMPFGYYFAELFALSGTGAEVSVYAAVA